MIFSCLLAAALVFSPEDAKAAFDLTADFVRDNPRRDAGTECGKAAARWLADRISAAGGKARLDGFRAMSPDGMREFVNLYCAFERRPGTPWTVLVSHYDTKPGTGCPGANDGGSTSCLLVGISRILASNRAFDRNVLLIWTDGEECRGSRYAENDGFQGSKRAAATLREMKLEVSGVYVLDMLGDRDLGITIPSNASPEPVRRAIAAAHRVGLRIARRGTAVLDDHVAFLNAGFPAVDLIDFEYGSAPGLNDYWHTPSDTPDRLSSDSLLSVGRLAVGILSAEVGK